MSTQEHQNEKNSSPLGQGEQAYQDGRASTPATSEKAAPESGGTTAGQLPPGMKLANALLTRYETETLFAQMEDQIDLIQKMEEEIVEDRSVIVATDRTMSTLRYEKRRAGVEGKNEAEREAALAAVLAQDALYVRAQQEEEAANSRIGMKQAGLHAAQRRFTAIRLQTEARISSKNLLSVVLGS